MDHPALVWLIEADVFGRSFEPMRLEMRRQGITAATVRCSPFVRGLRPEVRGRPLGPNACVMFSGTYPLMRHIQLHTAWIPGGFCNAAAFDCAAYYPHFEPHLLNADYATVDCGETGPSLRDAFDRSAVDGRVFARPSRMDKTFTGRLFEYDELHELNAALTYAKSERIMVTAPRTVEREWRLVVVGQDVVAASQYLDRGRLAVVEGAPLEVMQFTAAVLDEVAWRPDPVFVFDVCACEDRLFLLELGSFSCCGLYACDPKAVVTRAKSLMYDEWERRHG